MKQEETILSKIRATNAAAINDVKNSGPLLIASDSLIIMSKAVEMMIKELTARAWRHTRRSKKNTVSNQFIREAVMESEVYDFLIDIVPRSEVRRQGRAGDAGGRTSSHVYGVGTDHVGDGSDDAAAAIFQLLKNKQEEQIESETTYLKEQIPSPLHGATTVAAPSISPAFVGDPSPIQHKPLLQHQQENCHAQNETTPSIGLEVHPKKILQFFLTRCDPDCDDDDDDDDSASINSNNVNTNSNYSVITLTHTGDNFKGYIAFKIKTTHPHRYIVRPNQGVLVAPEKKTISVFLVEKERKEILLLEDKKLGSAPSNVTKNKFLIQSSAVKNKESVDAYIDQKGEDMSKLTAAEFEKLVGISWNGSDDSRGKATKLEVDFVITDGVKSFTPSNGEAQTLPLDSMTPYQMVSEITPNDDDPILGKHKIKGIRGDARMYRALAARLAKPQLSLYQALVAGGFKFPCSVVCDGSGRPKTGQGHIRDSDGILLTQRNQQLRRRLRLHKKKVDEEEKRRQQQGRGVHGHHQIGGRGRSIAAAVAATDDDDDADPWLRGDTIIPTTHQKGGGLVDQQLNFFQQQIQQNLNFSELPSPCRNYD